MKENARYSDLVKLRTAIKEFDFCGTVKAGDLAIFEEGPLALVLVPANSDTIRIGVLIGNKVVLAWPEQLKKTTQ